MRHIFVGRYQSPVYGCGRGRSALGRGNKGALHVDGNNNYRAPDVLLCKQTTLIAKSEDWRSSFRISTNHALRRPSLLVKVSQGPERPADLGWPTPTSLCYFSKRAASKQGSISNTQASAHQLSGRFILSSTFAYSIRRDVTEPATGETPSYTPRATHHAPGRPRPRADCRDGQR